MSEVLTDEFILKRVNIRVSKEVDEYYTLRSLQTGVPKSSLMFLALENEMKNSFAMMSLPKMMEHIEKNEVKQLERNVE